jgi:hypothetical protein
VKQIKRFRALIPPWQMPSDPIKAVWWFLRWLLTVLVHFFWIPILGMIIFEVTVNGNTSGFLSALWSGLVTLLVGLIVWGALYAVLTVVKVVAGISRAISNANEFQRTFASQRSADTFRHEGPTDQKIIESTIVEVKEEKPPLQH